MAMIECSECHKQISDQAQTCPNCGNPINENNSKLVQLNTAPNKRRKYRIRLLIFTPIFLFGSFMSVVWILGGGGGKLYFWLTIALIGFIGMVASDIGGWLAAP